MPRQDPTRVAQKADCPKYDVAAPVALPRTTDMKGDTTTMPHETPLIATIVAGLGLAFVFGALANRFRIPPLVGYLLAGVLVGPYTPGFVADQGLALELAEIGVILLMFGVGLHFSLKDLLSVRAIAVPGAVVQIAFATALGAGLAWMMGWTIGAGIVFGLALSVASTVVLLRALQERRVIETERGRIAVGWLIVEDLAMVLALVPPAGAGWRAGGRDAGGCHSQHRWPVRSCCRLWRLGVIALTLIKVAAFVVFMLVVGRRVIRGCCITWPIRARGNSSALPCWRLRSASPSERPSCSASLSRWAPSSPA